jgi:ankyrin repeat protein
MAAGADANVRARNGKTPLGWAAQIDRPLAVELLIRAGADPNLADAQGRTALHLVFDSAKQVSVPVIEAILRAGADPDLLDHAGISALRGGSWFSKTAEGHAFACNFLLETLREEIVGAAPAERREAALRCYARRVGTTGVLLCMERGHITRALELIDARADVRPPALLVKAAALGHTELVAELLRRGFDPDASVELTTPLEAAARTGQVALVERLLAAGADICACDDYGENVVTAAAGSHGSAVPVLEVLWAHVRARGRSDEERARWGEQLVNPTPVGYTPLHRARHMATVLWLVERGAAMEVVNSSRTLDTPLLHHLREGREDLAVLLVEHGADIERTNKEGDTPLLIACRKGLLAAARALLGRGADPEHTNLEGETPRRLAALRPSSRRCSNRHPEPRRRARPSMPCDPRGIRSSRRSTSTRRRKH